MQGSAQLHPFVTLFAVLLFGILEFGLTFRDYLTVANVSRDSARGGSAYGDGLYADYNIIQVARQSSKGFRPNEIRRLVVFDAGSVSGSIFNTGHAAYATGDRARKFELSLALELSYLLDHTDAAAVYEQMVGFLEVL